MEVEHDGDGSIWFRGLAPLHADTLLRLREWLENEDPKVRERLLPDVYDEPEAVEQWQRYANPELEHLFESRIDTVERDLQNLTIDDDRGFTLCIPRGHTSAWLSTLNAARLALFELHRLDAEDMEREPADLDDPEAELALIRIHLMAYMQELMLVDPDDPGFGIPGDATDWLGGDEIDNETDSEDFPWGC